MIDRDDGLDPKYRMPRSFGHAPGPRNLPESQRHRRYEKEMVSYTVSAHSDAGMLSAFLPEGLALLDEPRLEVSIISFTKIGWLAGRGYDILIVRVPVRWTEHGEQCAGHFVPVVWENLADPIITGREELGWSKIFADISVSDPSFDQVEVSASWDGHCFFDLRASDFARADLDMAAQPMVFEKYIPATGGSGTPDAHYLTVTAPDGPAPQIRSTEVGQGSFAFANASWEQMPTQYPIVNALAALPLSDFGPVVKIAASGGGDGSAQRRLEAGS